MANPLLLAGRIALTALVAAYLYHRLDWRSLRAVAVSTDSLLVLAAACLHGGGIALGAARWRLLLAEAGFKVAWGQAFRIALIGLYFNLLYLGSVGGDVAKFVIVLPSAADGKLKAAISLVQDRIIGLGALLSLLTALIIVRYPELRRDDAVHTLSVAVVTACIAYWTTLAIWWRGVPRTTVMATTPGNWRERFAATWQSLLPRKALLPAMALSLAIHGLGFMAGFVAARGVGLDLPLTTTSVVLGLTTLALSLPLTIAGLGVRDGMLIWLLAILGKSTTVESAGLSTCLLAISLAWSLVGGFLLLWPNPSRDHVRAHP